MNTESCEEILSEVNVKIQHVLKHIQENAFCFRIYVDDCIEAENQEKSQGLIHQFNDIYIRFIMEKEKIVTNGSYIRI